MRWFCRVSPLLDNSRHGSWSVFRRPEHIQTTLRRQAKGQLYLRVSYQDLYHAGLENMRLIVSVQCGKQISQCQDVSRSGRPEGERRKRKQNKKQKLFPWPQQKNLPPVPHLVLGCIFLKFYSLQEVPTLSRSAWQQKCLERDLNWHSNSGGAHNAHKTEKWKREKSIAPTFCLSKRESGWYLPSEMNGAWGYLI